MFFFFNFFFLSYLCAALIGPCAVMVDHEVKLTATSGSASDNSDNGLNNVGVLTAEPQSLGNYSAVPAQVASCTPPPPVPGPPVPVPYRG
jgi:hypothetical protein